MELTTKVGLCLLSFSECEGIQVDQEQNVVSAQLCLNLNKFSLPSFLAQVPVLGEKRQCTAVKVVKRARQLRASSTN